MALYEIMLEQRYAGQQIINRWNYVSDAIPSGQSGALLALVGMGFTPFTDIDPFFDGSVAFQLQEIQVPTVLFVQAIARNLYSVTDFQTYAFPPNTTGGAPAGDGESPVLAYGFASDRTRADIRRAQKRFAGVGASAVDSLGVIDPAALANVQLLGDAMGDINIVPYGGGTVSFTPHVFGRESYTTPSGKTAYKYYDTEAEQLDHIARINEFNAKPEVRTQVSRQYGRGS